MMEIENAGELCLPLIEIFNPNGLATLRDPEIVVNDREILTSTKQNFLSAANDLRAQLAAARNKKTSATLFAGDGENIAIISLNPVTKRSMYRYVFETKFLQEVFTSDNIDAKRLYHYLQPSSLAASIDWEFNALQSCAKMAEVYQALPGASISTLVLKQPIHLAKWVPKVPYRGDAPGTRSAFKLPPLTLPKSFACLAMFESGTCNLEPESLSEVFAMSSGNSLYVASAVLFDPYEMPYPNRIQRMVGNLGRAGITFLISPSDVKVRESDPEKWMSINHNVFDGSLENHFERTSVHLSFTEYEIPLLSRGDSRHKIDRDVVLVEALLSVYDGASWVAEIDILKALESDITILPSVSLENGHFVSGHINHASYEEAFQDDEKVSMISIENWDELIELPCSGTLVMRTHKSWISRLAAISDVGYLYYLLILAGLAAQKQSADVGRIG
ncbi:hypothetical protein ACMFMF_007050 [Clarireedia jacksonii]